MQQLVSIVQYCFTQGDDFAVRLRDRKCQLYALHVPKGEALGDQEEACPAVVVQWYTCVVCLEEKEDIELTVHPKCDGKVCRPCLKVRGIPSGQLYIKLIILPLMIEHGSSHFFISNSVQYFACDRPKCPH